jgi:hypothetical protein
MRVVLDGFRYMAGMASKGKLPGSLMPDEALLGRVGAAQTYVHQGEAPEFWRGWMGQLLGGLPSRYVARMQDILGGMETGWRQSLWDALARNPETAKLDPLIRGAMVAERAGNPRNAAALVRAFEVAGGPFVAYRLGIVPKAVFNAVLMNPQRVLAAVRPILDLQQNRSEQAQHQNVLMFNDPVENAARFATSMNPFGGASFLNYIFSPSTIGLLGIFQQYRQALAGEPVEQALWEYGQSLNPLEQILHPLAMATLDPAQASTFNPMPGQRLSLTDHLVLATLSPLASFYFAKEANPRYAHAQHTRMVKETEKFWNDFYDVLTRGK